MLCQRLDLFFQPSFLNFDEDIERTKSWCRDWGAFDLCDVGQACAWLLLCWYVVCLTEIREIDCPSGLAEAANLPKEAILLGERASAESEFLPKDAPTHGASQSPHASSNPAPLPAALNPPPHSLNPAPLPTATQTIPPSSSLAPQRL